MVDLRVEIGLFLYRMIGCPEEEAREYWIEYIKHRYHLSYFHKAIEIRMSCGATLNYNSVDELPRESVCCSCGNPAHWFIKINVLGAN